MLTYRRSIYIGLGGLGVQVISKVKEFFNEKDEILPMIKYLGIDTNNHELQNSNLNNEEQVFLRTCNPIDLFQAQSQSFPWMPDENKGYITSLRGYGSGQIRSNGRFAFEVNRRIICERLQRYYHELVDIRLEMADIINSPNIDIHVVSSIAGGTGSGIIIELAKMIKEIIPNSNVMGYFFSDSFFQSIGIGWNIKANAYATLFELNSEMSSFNKPFDICSYIDNKTDHRNTIDLESAINSTVSTMCTIPSYGNVHCSFFDDVKAAMASGFYNQGQRMAWITSISSSAISYHKDKINYFIHYSLASRLVKSLLHTDYIIPNGVAELRCSIRNSLINFEKPSDIPLLHSMIYVDKEGGISINDERLQSEVSRLECSFRNRVLGWKDETKLQISTCIANLLQQDNTVSLFSIGHALSELLALIKMSKDTYLEDREELLYQNNQLKDELNCNLRILQEKLYSPLSRLYSAKIAKLKGQMIDVKYRLLKNEFYIICKYRVLEALSDLQTYCEEEIQRNNMLIQTMRNLSNEIDANLNNYVLEKVCSDADIDVTSHIISQLDIDKIIVNWDVVRTSLFETIPDHNICREYLIHLISRNIDITLDYNNLLVNVENFDIYICNMLRRSEVLLNVDYNGETVMHDESLVISTPPGLDQFINNIVANRLNINNFIIVQEEENEIRAYKTAFLFTPHSISGLNVNESFANSNEASVIETLKQGRYSPFTDKNYQNLYNATKGL